MFPLTRWSPARELSSVHQDIDEIFNRFFGRSGRWLAEPSIGMGMPAVNCVREGDNLKFHAELPGINPKDIDISITGNILTIKGEKKFGTEKKEEDYLVREIGGGMFERSFTLPSDVDIDKVQAKYSNGMLELTVPISAQMKGRKIQVEGGEEAKQVKAA
jgi:HSP20 family protein